MNLPATVAGRPISNRGVHGAPTGYHAYWMENATVRTQWLDRMEAMHLSWIVLLNDSDSVLERFGGKPVVLWLLERGIIPIIRDQGQLLAPFLSQKAVRETAAIYADFGLKPIWKMRNECADDREWVKHKTPPDWFEQYCAWFAKYAPVVFENGGLPFFADAPLYDYERQNPFAVVPRELWDAGAGFGSHNYGKNRDLDYPRDNVSRFGTPITMEEYRAALDDYADDANWNEAIRDPGIINKINKQRRDWANPEKTVFQDQTCWHGWQVVVYYSHQTLGYVVPMAMLEGGFVPRDRPGSGGETTDIRWPYTTPKMVAKKTLAMYQEDTPFIAICPWLLACKEMGGSGWEDDSWVGGSFSDKYGLEKPVVKLLHDNPPGQRASRAELVRRARDKLDAALKL